MTRLSQTKTKRYDFNKRLVSNESYHNDHTLAQSDVDKVNALVERIESSRSAIKPEAGDRLLYTSKHGDYSPVAFIEKNRDRELSVCVRPMIPFVETGKEGICYDVSGGPFTGMHESGLKYAGTVMNHFGTWGHSGPRANGSVHFQAEVSMWGYADPEPLYGDFTTKTRRKIIVNKTINPATGYLYKGDGFTFENERQYQGFLDTFRAVITRLFPAIIKNPFSIHPLQDPQKHGSYLENAPLFQHLHRTGYN